ncbi:hypothetical protein D3C75_1273250 [compost metagenome]
MIEGLTVSSRAKAATSSVRVFSAMPTQISSRASRRWAGARANAAGMARLSSISAGRLIGSMPVRAMVCCMKSIATKAW